MEFYDQKYFHCISFIGHIRFSPPTRNSRETNTTTIRIVIYFKLIYQKTKKQKRNEDN